MTLKTKLGSRAPKTAVILGSALGSVVNIVEDPLIIPYTELPGFPVPKISGHAGKLYVGTVGGQEVAVLAGLKAGERVVTQGALQLKLQELNPAEAGAHTHET